MDVIETNSTEVEAWQKLVHHAGESCQQALDEELESYLVFLLMRHTADTSLADSIMAIRYLQGLQSGGQTGIRALQDVGDQCLLYTGLFPKRSERRLVKVSYYVRIGRSAYAQMATKLKQDTAALYDRLAEQFTALMDILQAMRQNSAANANDVLDLLESARDSESERAKRLLSEQNILVFPK